METLAAGDLDMKDGVTDLEKKIPSNEEHENFQTFEKMNTHITKKHDILADRMFNLIRKPNFWSKINPGTTK